MPKTAKPSNPESHITREKLLKWVGGITAVLSLIFGVIQFIRLVADVRERERQVTEFYEVGKRQQASADYSAAWISFEQAAKSAESGGLLAKLMGQPGEQRLNVRRGQEDLAMEWLRNIRASQGQTFSRIVEPLVLVLERGILSATGPRKADLIAHAGWAHFLRWREGRRDLNPEQHYRQALEVDPTNPYAHANWGHWQLWRRERVEDANQHFSAALSSGRARDYVRNLQLAALKNLGSDGDSEFLTVVNEMRKNNESIEAQFRNDLYSIYYFACSRRGDSESLTKLLAAVPAAEQVVTFRALFYGEHDGDFDQWKRQSRDACLATLLEAAGEREEALQMWLDVRQNLSSRDGGSLSDRAHDAIQRLSSSR